MEFPNQIQTLKCLLAALIFPLKSLNVLGYCFAPLGVTVVSFTILWRNGDFIVAELVDLCSCLTTSPAHLTSLSDRQLRRFLVSASHLIPALPSHFLSTFDHAVMFAEVIFRGPSSHNVK